MLNTQDFAIEALETRLETLWLYLPYLGTCSKKIWFVTVYYPCIKWHWVWV